MRHLFFVIGGFNSTENLKENHAILIQEAQGDKTTI